MTIITSRATTAEKAKAWDRLMASTGENDSINLQEAWEYLSMLVRAREQKSHSTRRPKQSEAMKRFLAIKFPTPSESDTIREWQNRMMTRDESGNIRFPQYQSVDVTLTHGTTVIHVNDRKGERTAAEYLKTL